MNKYQSIVDDVVRMSDVILLVLDSRNVEETRNFEVEEQIKRYNKPLIYVITKSDMLNNRYDAEKYKRTLIPCVFISSREYHGISLLKERIIIESKKYKIEKEPINVGVIGYPNVGKSSLINAMTNRSAASTSSMSGHTKSLQKIRASSTIVFIDTPGVIPYGVNDKAELSMIGSIDYTKDKNPELTVMELMEKYPGKIENFYAVAICDDYEETLESIARKTNYLKKGNEPNTDKAARAILRDWQSGKIKK